MNQLHIFFHVLLHITQSNISENQEPHLHSDDTHAVVKLSMLNTIIKPIHLKVVIQLIPNINRQDVCCLIQKFISCQLDELDF